MQLGCQQQMLHFNGEGKVDYEMLLAKKFDAQEIFNPEEHAMGLTDPDGLFFSKKNTFVLQYQVATFCSPLFSFFLQLYLKTSVNYMPQTK